MREKVQVIPPVYDRSSDRIGYLPELHAYLSNVPARQLEHEELRSDGPPRKRQRLSAPSSVSSEQVELQSTVVLVHLDVRLVSRPIIKTSDECGLWSLAICDDSFERT